jgi:hypothetical protein
MRRTTARECRMTTVRGKPNTQALDALRKIAQGPADAKVSVTAKQFEKMGDNLALIAQHQPQLASAIASLMMAKFEAGNFKITGLKAIPDAHGAQQNAISSLMTRISDASDSPPMPSNPGLVR